jgi:hypothetical protein
MPSASPHASGPLSVRRRALRQAASTAVEMLEGRRLMSVTAVDPAATVEEGSPYALTLHRDAGETSVSVKWTATSTAESFDFTGDTLELSHTYADDGAVQITIAPQGGVVGGGDGPLEVVAPVTVVPFDQGDEPVTSSSTATVVAAAPGAKFATASSSAANSGDIVLGQFNADGTPDANFGPDGNGLITVTLPPGSVTSVGAVAVNEDGQIFAAGFTFDPEVGTLAPLVVRVESDGTNAATFVATVADQPLLALSGIATLPDGGVVVCGGDGPNGHALVGKLKPVGNSLDWDTSFAGTGYVIESFDSETFPDADPLSDSVDQANAVTVAGGQVVVAGLADFKLALARYSMTGERIATTFTGAAVELIGGITPAGGGGDVFVTSTIRDDDSVPEDGITSDILLTKFVATGVDPSFGGQTDVSGDDVVDDADAGFARASFSPEGAPATHNDDQSFGLSVIGDRVVVTGYSSEPGNSDYSMAVALFDAEGGALTDQLTVTEGFQVHGRAAVSGGEPGSIVVAGFGEGMPEGNAGRGLVIATLTRGEGEPGNSDPSTVDVEVLNVDPIAAIAAGGATSATEGTAVSYDGSATDAGVNDVLELTWSVLKDDAPYGPTGTGAAFAFTPGDEGEYVITLTATDGDGGVGTATRALSVTNVAPDVTLAAPAAVVLGGSATPVTFDVTAADAGADDVIAATVNFGDGTAPQTVTLPRGASTLSHTYAAGGQYTVTIATADGDGGADSASASLKVIAVTQPAGGNLAVDATAGGDAIAVSGTGSDLSLSVDGVALGTFNVTGRVSINAGSGNDVVRVLGLTAGADVYGGAGNDVILGGNGGGVLVGGAGNDAITGGTGRDILIGGNNGDVLLGAANEDILIGGRTSFDDDPTALGALRAAWQQTGSTFAQRVGAVTTGSGVTGGYALRTDGASQTVFDDAAADQLAVDLLAGGDGADFYIYNYQQSGIQDIVLGLGGNDTRADSDPT